MHPAVSLLSNGMRSAMMSPPAISAFTPTFFLFSVIIVLCFGLYSKVPEVIDLINSLTG